MLISINLQHVKQDIIVNRGESVFIFKGSINKFMGTSRDQTITTSSGIFLGSFLKPISYKVTHRVKPLLWFSFPLFDDSNLTDEWASRSFSAICDDFSKKTEDTITTMRSFFALRMGYVNYWINVRLRLNNLLPNPFRRHRRLSNWVLIASKPSINSALLPIELLTRYPWYQVTRNVNSPDQRKQGLSYLNKKVGHTVGPANMTYNWKNKLS